MASWFLEVSPRFGSACLSSLDGVGVCLAFGGAVGWREGVQWYGVS